MNWGNSPYYAPEGYYDSPYFVTPGIYNKPKKEQPKIWWCAYCGSANDIDTLNCPRCNAPRIKEKDKQHAIQWNVSTSDIVDECDGICQGCTSQCDLFKGTLLYKKIELANKVRKLKLDFANIILEMFGRWFRKA